MCEEVEGGLMWEGGVCTSTYSGGWVNNVVGRRVIAFEMLMCWRVPAEWPGVLFQVVSSILTWYACKCREM